MSPLMRGAAFCALLFASGCTLPRSGPSKNEVFEGSVLRSGDAFVILVTDRVNQIASVAPLRSFSSRLSRAARLDSDTVRPGDTLTLTIWENVEQGLLSNAAAPATVLPEVQVDDQGFIFVPYAGRIRAAGNSPEAIRRLITNKLEDQTPDPQVQVQRLAGDGATVTLLGDGAGQGVLPIERSNRTLLQMLARSGGLTSSPSGTKVTVIRGNVRESVYFQDLMDNPGQDIALRNGDQILVEADQRSFTILGATIGQTELPFRRSPVSAMEAIAQVGGLNPNTADPTGVFVMRNEDEAITEALTGVDVTGVQRVVYVLDLTAPNGMFMARDFAIRDQDTVYATEAPIVQFNKVIATLTGSLTGVRALSGTASSLIGGSSSSSSSR